MRALCNITIRNRYHELQDNEGEQEEQEKDPAKEGAKEEAIVVGSMNAGEVREREQRMRRFPALAFRKVARTLVGKTSGEFRAAEATRLRQIEEQVKTAAEPWRRKQLGTGTTRGRDGTNGETKLDHKEKNGDTKPDHDEKHRGTKLRQRQDARSRMDRGLLLGGACTELQIGRGVTQGRWRGARQTISILREVVPDGIHAVEELDWEELEMAVDSGATETVVNEDMLKNIETKEGSAYRRGVEYEVANGEYIPNLGEKKFLGVGENGEARHITAQVCAVNKALLSVKKMVQAGNRVVFEQAGGYIEDVVSGERLHLKEQGGMYMLKMWVQRPFPGQAQ